MRISDWSAGGCSSYLRCGGIARRRFGGAAGVRMIATRYRRPAGPRRLVRGEQGGGVDLETVGRGPRKVSARLWRVEAVRRSAKQDATVGPRGRGTMGKRGWWGRGVWVRVNTGGCVRSN